MSDVVVWRADVSDTRHVTQLISKVGGPARVKPLFGNYNLASTIDLSLFNLVCQQQEDDEIVGFVSVNDTPPCDVSVHDLAWVSMQMANRQIRRYNTLFLNFLVMDPAHVEAASKPLFRALFEHLPRIDFIVMAHPKGVAHLMGHAELLQSLPLGSDDQNNDFVKSYDLLHLARSSFIPRLGLREAQIEDFDDLLPIFMNSDFLQHYDRSPFTLQEMIQQQGPNNKVFVGLANNSPVVMVAAIVSSGKDDWNGFIDAAPTPKESEPIANSATTVAGSKTIAVLGVPGSGKSTHARILSRTLQVPCISTQDFPYMRQNDGDSDNESSTSTDSESPNSDDTDRLAAIVQRLQQRDCQNGYVLDGIPTTLQELQVLHEANLLPQAFLILEAPKKELIQRLAISRSIDTGVEEQEPIEQELSQAIDEHVESLQQTKAGLIECGVSLARQATISTYGATEDVAKTIWSIVHETKPPASAKVMRKSSAVTVTLRSFCVHQDFSSQAHELLRIIFAEFPAAEYAVMTVPHSTPPTKLLDAFRPVPTPPEAGISEAILVASRTQWLAERVLRVERYNPNRVGVDALQEITGSSHPAIIELLNSHAQDHEIVSLKHNPARVIFTVLVDQSVEGIIVLSRSKATQEENTLLQAFYNLDEYVSLERHRTRSQAHVKHWLLSNRLSACAAFILQEIMRLYDKTLLFVSELGQKCPLDDGLLYQTVPLRRRKRSSHDGEDRISSTSAQAAMRVVSKRMLCTPKTTILSKIVVVGGSTCAISMVEELVLAGDCFLPNVTLITPNPIHDQAYHTMVAQGKSMTCMDVDMVSKDELDALGIGSAFAISMGHVTRINQAEMAVTINDGIVVPYDTLVLAPTKQDASHRQLHGLGTRHARSYQSMGVFLLGLEVTGIAASAWLENHPNNLVVYGCTMTALCAISTALRLGVQGSCITWISPWQVLGVETEPPAFTLHNGQMNELIRHSLAKEHGVTILENKRIAGVQFKDQQVSAVTIKDQKSGEEVERICGTLLCANDNAIDADLLEACTSCGLVYNAGLVVDENYRTAADGIYAIGSTTRISRQFAGGQHQIFAECNNKEVAQRFAAHLLSQAIPESNVMKTFSAVRSGKRHFIIAQSTATTISHRQEDASNRVRFDRPVTSMTTLLLDFLYIRCAAPLGRADLHEYVTNDATTEAITTLKTDALGVLAEAVYLGKQHFDPHTFCRIVGWHETLLRDAVNSYIRGEILDWSSYLTDKWITAVLHDGFGGLVSECRAALTLDQGTTDILEKLRATVEQTNDDIYVASVINDCVGDGGSALQEPTQRILDNILAEFLRRHKHTLGATYDISILKASLSSA